MVGLHAVSKLKCIYSVVLNMNERGIIQKEGEMPEFDVSRGGFKIGGYGITTLGELVLRNIDLMSQRELWAEGRATLSR